MKTRHAKFYELNTHLAHIDNEGLNALLAESGETRGWGKNHTIELKQSKVFIKRIPLTHLEYNQMFSTKNHYDLPSYYNYGVGSAGFGAFRELLRNGT